MRPSPAVGRPSVAAHPVSSRAVAATRSGEPARRRCCSWESFSHSSRRAPERGRAVGGLAAYPRGRVRRLRPAADRCRRAARAGGRPGAAHPAHRRQGRRAGRDGRRAGRAHRRGAGRQRRRRARPPPPTGRPESVLDRLRLDAGRVAGVAAALRDLVALPDPVGDVVRGSTLPNGLQLRQVRVPLGVVGIVYEARPNVTVDAAGLCLKSGNAALLRGSASAFGTNTALVAVLTEAAEKAGLPDGLGRAAARRPRVGRRAAERPRPGRRGHPARWGVADRAGRPRVDRAGDRDRRRQLPRLRRRLRRRRRWPRRSCSTPRPTG